jgi:transcriptional regulator with XRE-family HTH domain
MDALRIGRSLRALRIRRGLRQADVASAAGISRSQYGRIERGALRRTTLAGIEDACEALGADLDVRVRWHGEGLDRLLDAAHADLVNRVVRLLAEFGWESAVEVSFNHFGDRGAVDVLGWHPLTRALLVIEAKSVIPDAQATISSHDRKARLADVIGRSRGWEPRIVGRLLVVADSSTSRRRVLDLAGVFGSAYPDRAIAVRRWLKNPVGRLCGLQFFPIAHRDGTRRGPAARERVQRVRKPPDPGQ